MILFVKKTSIYFKRAIFLIINSYKENGVRGMVAVFKILVKKLLFLAVTRVVYKLNDRNETNGQLFDFIFSQNNRRSPHYVEFKQKIIKQKFPVKLISFYLPQFHSIPENDHWWGKGFTEWTNVSKAFPEFIEHYQPRLPGELGFYNLEDELTLSRQVQIAKNYGIGGFCFYYYWFNGKRLLEKPIDLILASKEIDFPFCFCWANENWTRRWDGLENEILISQTHSDDDDISFFNNILPALKDPRYITVDFKPLLLIYNPLKMPNPKKSATLWRKLAKDAGLPGLFLACVHGISVGDPTVFGFDAAVEFPPADPGIFGLSPITAKYNILNNNFQGAIYDYDHMMFAHLNRQLPNYPVFRGVCPSWDNSSRKPGRGHIFVRSMPVKFQHWLEKIIKNSIEIARTPDERIIFINAWNEWAEGAYLEPDRKFGFAYLESVYNALQTTNVELNEIAKNQRNNFKKKSSVAIIIHLFYPEMAAEFCEKLKAVEDCDVFITIPNFVSEDQLRNVISYFPTAYVLQVSNRGRDILPFLQAYKVVNEMGYKLICKLHSKKSLHREDGAEWRNAIVDDLIGSKAQVISILKKLEKDDTGIIGPADHLLKLWKNMGSNYYNCKEILRILNLSPVNLKHAHFIAGSMFWFKSEALLPLLSNTNFEDKFEFEDFQLDGTHAHAIERLFVVIGKSQGFESTEIKKFDSIAKKNKKFV